MWRRAQRRLGRGRWPGYPETSIFLCLALKEGIPGAKVKAVLREPEQLLGGHRGAAAGMTMGPELAPWTRSLPTDALRLGLFLKAKHQDCICGALRLVCPRQEC